MTFDEALAVAIKAKEKWGGGSSEAWLINCMEAVGVLKLDRPPQTLWELLRKHGIAIDKAQAICNEAMNEGVKVPYSPQDVADTLPRVDVGGSRNG